MTLKHKVFFCMAVIAFLAVAAVGSLFWFNWWIRNSWTRMYPICFDGDTLVEFTEPMTDEAFELYTSYMTRGRNADYSYRDSQAIYVKRWYWLFGDGEHLQITGLVNDGLAKAHGQEENRDIHCSEIARIGTPSGGRGYQSGYYPPNWVRDNLQLVSFHVLGERFGYYTPVGEFLRQFEISDIRPAP